MSAFAGFEVTVENKDGKKVVVVKKKGKIFKRKVAKFDAEGPK